MQQQEQPRWRPTRRQVLWTVGVVIALAALIGLIRIGYAQHWTGFGRAEVEKNIQPAKSFRQ